MGGLPPSWIPSARPAVAAAGTALSKSRSEYRFPKWLAALKRLAAGDLSARAEVKFWLDDYEKEKHKKGD